LESTELVLFTCPAPAYCGLRLTPTACAENWKRAKTAAPWDRLFPCRGCEIGAGHAREPPPGLDPGDDGRACLWCGRKGQRLTAKVLCISCYNRARELRTGSYRREAPPNLNRLHVYEVSLEVEHADPGS